jgi:Tfp pilus assembly protein PilN
MPQQINLCTGVLKTQRQRFTARTMLPALAVFLAVGGALCAAAVWSTERSAADYRQTLDTQATEIQSLQAAITQSRANAAPVNPALVQQLQDRRAAVLQREKVLQDVQQGMFRSGEGHSDRLLLVARSIPSAAWVSSATLDAGRFEVTGFTLEPSSLNDWVAQLAASPLMRGLKLSTITVENKGSNPVAVPATASAAVPANTAVPRALWAFTLVSLEPVPVAMGGKP